MVIFSSVYFCRFIYSGSWQWSYYKDFLSSGSGFESLQFQFFAFVTNVKKSPQSAQEIRFWGGSYMLQCHYLNLFFTFFKQIWEDLF